MALSADFTSADYFIKSIELQSGRILRLAIISRPFTFYPTGEPIIFPDAVDGQYVDKYNVKYKTGTHQIQLQAQFACFIGTYGMDKEDPNFDRVIVNPGVGYDKFTEEEKKEIFSSYQEDGDIIYGLTPDITKFGFSPFVPVNNIPAYEGVVPFFPLADFAPQETLKYFFGQGNARTKYIYSSTNLETSGNISVNVNNKLPDNITSGLWAIPVVRTPFLEVNDYTVDTFTLWYCDIVPIAE